MLDFLLMDHPTACNITIDMQFLIKTKAVISIHYLAMKVLIVKDVITIKEDQQPV